MNFSNLRMEVAGYSDVSAPNYIASYPRCLQFKFKSYLEYDFKHFTDTKLMS
jgi:hypothetical protein